MDFEKLKTVFNTLTQIETKGESTILMGACLQTLREMLQTMASEAGKQKEA